MPSRRTAICALAAMSWTCLAIAPSLGVMNRAMADDETILKVSANGKTTEFSLAALDAMKQTSIRTGLPWYEGVGEFSGVSLKDVLNAVGATGGTLQMTALNDYVVSAPTQEMIEADALLATRHGGQPMPISDKGPIFVLFPFDDRPELKHQAYYSRAVWQLDRIEVDP